jgi:hypothetical protein
LLDYSTFYDIAEYGNKAWRGYFTPKEVAVNAYEYLYAYEESKASGEPTETIKELARLLALDGSDQCKTWLYYIAEALDLIDMDWRDYADTDEWLNQFLT